jgi:hypothetical protein
MIKPSGKATMALEKQPIAKLFRSRWLPDGDYMPSLNTNLSRLFDTRTDTFQQRPLDWPLHMLAI